MQYQWLSSSSYCFSKAAARLVITISLYTADRTFVEDILKRVKVQKRSCAMLCIQTAVFLFQLQYYALLHYAVVILLLQSRPAQIAELPRSKFDPELFPHGA